jgi:hypothetical protein
LVTVQGIESWLLGNHETKRGAMGLEYEKLTENIIGAAIDSHRSM